MCDHTPHVSEIWRRVQRSLFPYLESVVESPLTDNHRLLVWVIETVRPEQFLPAGLRWRRVGAPEIDRKKIAAAFLAKAVMDLPTTKALRERLLVDGVLRRLCGWEGLRDVPSESTFSRAHAMFAQTQLLDRVHQALAERQLSGEIVWHISRDATAIEGREKRAPKPEAPKPEAPKPEAPKPETATSAGETAPPAPRKRGRGRPKKCELRSSEVVPSIALRSHTSRRGSRSSALRRSRKPSASCPPPVTKAPRRTPKATRSPGSVTNSTST